MRVGEFIETFFRILFTKQLFNEDLTMDELNRKKWLLLVSSVTKKGKATNKNELSCHPLLSYTFPKTYLTNCKNL